MLKSSPLLVADRVHVTAVKRDRRDAHLRARILHLPAVNDVDQRHVLLVVDATHRKRFEDKAEPLGKHLLAARAGVDVADRHRPGLLAGDRRVGWIDEPVSLGEPVDHATAEPADMAGHALDLRVRDRLDDNAVAGPIVPESATSSAAAWDTTAKRVKQLTIDMRIIVLINGGGILIIDFAQCSGVNRARPGRPFLT